MKRVSRSGNSFKNAVLLKEVQVKSKRPGMSVCILIVNIILAIAALITMVATNTSIVSGYSVESNTFIIFFMVVVIIEAIVLFFAAPAISAGAIASERERQTLDVLLTTSMTPWQIVWGKYWSSIANALVLLISTLPVLSVVYMFGGVSFFTVMGTLLALIGCVMYLGTFGILTSTAIRKTNAASVICYILLLGITFGCISIVSSIVSISSAINEVIINNNPNLSGTTILKPDWSLVLLFFSPATVAYDILSKGLGFDLFFMGDEDGMGYFVELITDGRLASNCFIGKYWSVIALAVQLLTGYGLLKLAAANLNPVKHKKSKKAAAAPVKEKG